MNEWPAKCLSLKRARNSRSLRVFIVNCAWRSGRKEKSAKYLLDSLRLRAVSLLLKNPRGRTQRRTKRTSERRLATSRPFLSLDLFIYLGRGVRIIYERRGREGVRLRLKSRVVDLFHLRGCESERKCFGAKSMIDISHFSCAPCVIVAKEENDFHQNVYEYCSLTQMNLFVMCTVQYVVSNVDERQKLFH